MHKGKRILAIVTARGGSKGLPGKNIKVINGIPLIGWTLNQLRNSKYFDEVYVSTDSREIAHISEEFGFPVPNLRPAYLADDTASSVDVLLYTIQQMEDNGKVFDYVLLAEPTSPLRKKEDFDRIIELAVESPEADGVISVGEVQMEHPLIIKKISQDGFIIPYVENRPELYQRQQFDRAYFPYGGSYLVKVSRLKETRTIYMEHMKPYFIERWQNYEIDDVYDFVCLESIMQLEGANL